MKKLENEGGERSRSIREILFSPQEQRQLAQSGKSTIKAFLELYTSQACNNLFINSLFPTCAIEALSTIHDYTEEALPKKLRSHEDPGVIKTENKVTNYFLARTLKRSGNVLQETSPFILLHLATRKSLPTIFRRLPLTTTQKKPCVTEETAMAEPNLCTLMTKTQKWGNNLYDIEKALTVESYIKEVLKNENGENGTSNTAPLAISYLANNEALPSPLMLRLAAIKTQWIHHYFLTNR
jgi:hypothetical protein